MRGCPRSHAGCATSQSLRRRIASFRGIPPQLKLVQVGGVATDKMDAVVVGPARIRLCTIDLMLAGRTQMGHDVFDGETERKRHMGVEPDHSCDGSRHSIAKRLRFSAGGQFLGGAGVLHNVPALYGLPMIMDCLWQLAIRFAGCPGAHTPPP